MAADGEIERQYEVGWVGGWRGLVRERGRGRGRAHSSSAWNQSKKSIFNLAVRMAKLACQQRYHGLNYTKLPPRKGMMRGRERSDERDGESKEDREEDGGGGADTEGGV